MNLSLMDKSGFIKMFSNILIREYIKQNKTKRKRKKYYIFLRKVIGLSLTNKITFIHYLVELVGNYFNFEFLNISYSSEKKSVLSY